VDVKEAVAKAKDYTADLFAQEQLSDLALEEVEYNEPSNEWLVTLGFSRPWDKPYFTVKGLPAPRLPRSYKIVRVSDSSGRVISVKNREFN